MSARPKTLDETIELVNDLMDQKLRTYAERQNDNKRKTDDSSRNSQQKQPHKKQNVDRAYTVGPGEKKVYTWDLPLCTKCNYHHTGQCAPKCGKCKRWTFMGYPTYEEVSQQGQVHPLSPAYVPDPMELDEHVPVHVLEPEHSEYHETLDDDIQVEDDDEDPEEDPSEEHKPEDDDEDLEEDPNEEHEPEDYDETEPFEEDETAVTPLPPRHRGARISVRPQTPMAASTQALIDAFSAGSSPFPLPPTSPSYDQAPLGHKAAMIRRRDDIPEEDIPP
nr:reverse transcriptase domain-containing protein [Tanacetum cinerariifolium]